MSDKEELLDDDLATEEQAPVASAPSTAKSNLARRRVIDNLLDERRLQRRLDDYDFDL